MPLISLHLPKTGGTSLKHVLEQHFGSALRLDYGDLPMNTPRPRREMAALGNALRLGRTGLPDSVACVHGHFLALKYLTLRRAVFVTWLRDPVERLISHYRYWMKASTAAGLPPLHRRVVEEGWDLERFCLGPELRNTYHQFLIGFPVRRLDFVGIAERSDVDFPIFCQRYLGVMADAPMPKDNVGDAPGRRHLDDNTLRQRIAAWHAKDMALYQHFATRTTR